MTTAGIILHGGLGNRLFQIAFIYSYGKKWNKKIIINKDDWNTHSNIDYQKIVYPFVPKSLSIKSPLILEESSENCISYVEIPNLNQDCIFKGYFQCEKYFINYKKEIQSIFQLPNQNKYMIKENSVFVHVRRGDYVTKDFHFIDLTKYYEVAISHLRNINTNFTLYVISDDIQFCKDRQIFKNQHENIEYVEGLNELQTMRLMKECNIGGICANSTFSWWGAYLNPNEDKIVFFPSQWFNSKVKIPNDIPFEGSYVIDLEKYEIHKN